MAKNTKTQTFVTDRLSPIDGTPSKNQFPTEVDPDLADVLIVNLGVGLDSTGVLVGMHKYGIRPDYIFFADTGGEKPETYHYLQAVLRPWLAEIGFPDVTIVRKVVKKFVNDRPYETLQGNCIANSTLPSLAFGGKGCSQKWKAEPVDAAVSDLPEVKQAIAEGKKVVRVIGYEAGGDEWQRGRKKNAIVTKKDHPRFGQPATDCVPLGEWYEPQTDDVFHWSFPLRDWGWDRERLAKEISAAGLPVPMKSACWFCPASKKHEIKWLMETHPQLAQGIVEIERRATPVQHNQKADGLWGAGTKGCRGAEKKPGRMSDYLAELGFEPALRVDFKAIEATSAELLGGDKMPLKTDRRDYVDVVLSEHADDLFDDSSILITLAAIKLAA